ncbi:CBASS oligonucleotide cyclase [Psychrobacter sp. 5A.1]|uniref:CBASS oligonucleotide cyclase n=1 Tax=unclassified Psychrobacter TaxID=196806 RepID=UPI001919FD0E|nr:MULTISPECIES: CBASS oligonucleotide cyclase [unclassified Psychrobacter]MDN3503827.1 CBASS oligonucleotide cyclase [Psychrobacter sp. 5A.1]
MPLLNKELQYYDSNILRLEEDRRKKYHEQVDNLIKNLRREIKNQSELRIVRVVKAGSFAKYTILKKTNEDQIDVDLVFYIDDENHNSDSFKELIELIQELLIKIYPTKSVEDFEIQTRATSISFVGSGLDVDVVPVIQDSNNLDYGWQYDLNTGGKSLTCAPCHIKFVQNRKDEDKHYRTLVRMAKRWKNRAKPKGLKSFHIELILASIQDNKGPTVNIEERFRAFLLYIAQSNLQERIDFKENSSETQISFYDPVVIVDPANHQNNVASRITDSERKEIVEKAEEAWELANYASTTGDLKLWKELFGNTFKVEG